VAAIVSLTDKPAFDSSNIASEASLAEVLGSFRSAPSLIAKSPNRFI
jgi:hypothetical protein